MEGSAAAAAAAAADEMRSRQEQHDIVIVGGGICGLATALALHRKGMKSLVLEKSEKLRAEGAAIGIFTNGWRALDQLMVGMELRQKAIPITEIRDTRLGTNKTQITSCREGEVRCLKRSDLSETMAQKLPPDSIRFGCQVAAVEVDPVTSFPVLYTNNGIIIRTKVLIGCDGSNSIVARSLQLKDTTLFPFVVVRGFTSYQTSHSFGDHFLRLRFKNRILGRIPINDKLIYWFVGRTCPTTDKISRNDKKHIKELALEAVRGFPEEMVEIVEQGDLDSLSIGHIRYRHPWHLLTAKNSNGFMTVAGDAMHVMGPFLGQGGAAGMEDAVVLARCLAQEITPSGGLEDVASNLYKRVDAAFRKYIRERRMRVMRLSIQSYVTGLIITTQSSIVRMICVAILILIAFFGGGSLGHSRYNCGRL